jgi:1-aminocyclopropane-1-carboxylate deaminase/D-cysteine desulfhydrase-like pyridoxal-dependent ACC family enzyme
VELFVQLGNTPVTNHHFCGLHFYLKRDDLLHPQFSGNKARKFLSLLEQPPQDIKKIVGYGSPQANSLYSLAALAHLQNWHFDFYVDHIASYLKQNPNGNYAKALGLGARIIEVPPEWKVGTDNTESALKRYLSESSDVLMVEEGGRMPIAEYGIKGLANELIDWVESHTNSCEDGALESRQQWVVALPSGTGTTAFYLHKYLQPYGIEVVTTACVGGEDYLKAQFLQLSSTHSQPTIWSLDTKHHFGKLYQDDFQIWTTLMEQTGVEFELLYDPLMWRVLLMHKQKLSGKNLLYIHQGGLLGNESMLPRYQRKFANC